MQEDKLYKNDNEPEKFIKRFKYIAEFKCWAATRRIDVLEKSIEEFEEAGLYKYCKAISEVICTKKINAVLRYLDIEQLKLV